MNYRKTVLDFAKSMSRDNMAPGTTGNLSVIDRSRGLIYITPTSLSYDTMEESDIVVVDAQTGEVVEGTHKPSSELPMHRVFYDGRSDANAVIHTHSRYATLLACMGWDLEMIHYQLGMATKDKVRCTPYMLSHSKEFGETALRYAEGNSAVLLGNHGVLCFGPSMGYAYDEMQQVEFCAELYYKARLAGSPRILTPQEAEEVAPRFEKKRAAALAEIERAAAEQSHA